MKKALAVFIAATFIFNVSSQSLQAVVAGGVSPQAYDINKDFTVNEYFPSHLAGEGLAKQEGEGLPYSKTVFLIQDLHCHYDVQNKIASFLENLSVQPGFNKIYIEGASANIETSFIKNLPDNIKDVLVKDLLSQGKISGAEYFFLTSKQEIRLYGLEEKDLYDGNALRLEYILATQDKVRPIMSEMEKALNALQRKTLDKPGKKMLSAFKKYESGDMPQRKFYSYLIKQAEKSGINTDNYSSIKNISILPKKVNYKKVQKELQAYMQEAKNVLPYSAYKELTGEDVLDKIEQISAANKMDLKKYENLSGYLEVYKFEVKADPLKVYEEERSLLNDLLINGAERESLEITILTLAMEKLKNFMANKGTDADYKYIRDFKIASLEKLWGKYLDKAPFEKLLPYEKIYESYYRVNDLRNTGFVDKIVTGFDGNRTQSSCHPELVSGSAVNDLTTRSRNKFGMTPLEADNSVSVVITGGFHTEELKEMLLSKGIGVITLTPKITGGVKEAEEKYVKLFNEQRKADIAGAYIEGYALKSYLENEGLVSALGYISKLYAEGKFGKTSTEQEIIKKVIEKYNEIHEKEKSEIISLESVSADSIKIKVKAEEVEVTFDKDGQVESVLPQSFQKPAKNIKPNSIIDRQIKRLSKKLFKDENSSLYKFYTIAIAPIWEEWLFRGAPVIIASALSINPLIPLIISGILFVALHKVFNRSLTPRDLIILGGMTAAYTLGVFMLPAIPFIGFFFGAFQSVTGYIIPSVAMHFLYNFFVVYRVGIFKKAPVTVIGGAGILKNTPVSEEEFFKDIFSGSYEQNTRLERMLSAVVEGRRDDFLAEALAYDNKFVDYASNPGFMDSVNASFDSAADVEGRFRALNSVFSGIPEADEKLKSFLAVASGSGIFNASDREEDDLLTASKVYVHGSVPPEIRFSVVDADIGSLQFDKLFLGEYHSDKVTAKEIEKITKIEKILRNKSLGFAVRKIFYDVGVQYPKYNRSAFLQSGETEKQLVLNSLISKFPQSEEFALSDGRDKYIFAADRRQRGLKNIVKIYDLFVPQSGSKTSFLDYNEKALRLLNSVDSEESLNTVTNYIENMIEIISMIEKIPLMEMLPPINRGKAQKCRAAYDVFKKNIKGAEYPEIRESLNDLIKFVHKSGETAFFDIMDDFLYTFDPNFKNANVCFSNLADKNIQIINLSSDGKINHEIFKVFRNLMASPYKCRLSRIVLKDNTLFWSVRFGGHSVLLKADFSENNRGASISYYEDGNDNGKKARVDYFAEALKKIGYRIEDTKKNGSVAGLSASLNKDTGLNDYADLPYVLSETMLLFDSSVNIDWYFDLADNSKNIDLLIQRFFSGELRSFSYDDRTLNIKRFTKPQFIEIQQKLNPVLERSGLDMLSDNLATEYEDNPQAVIDKYFNEPLERAYAEGRVILNARGQLEKNANYDVVAEMANDMPGDNAGKLFEAGTIINQIINPRYFKFKEVAKLGGQNTLQTGYIQLENGDYLSVKMIVSKGRTVKAAKAELVSDDGRKVLDSKNLIKILKQEGYQELEAESISKSEKEYFIESLKQKIEITNNQDAGAYVTSKGRNELFAGEVIIDADRSKIRKIVKNDPERAKRLIWAAPYTTPDDIEILDKVGAVLTLGGGYLSHAAISTRERNKMSMVLSGAVLQKDGSIEIASVKPKPETEIRNISGIQAQDVEGVKITVKNGDKVLLNSSFGTIEFLSPKESLEQYEYISDASPPAASVKLQTEKRQKESLDKLSISNIVKTFRELKPEDKNKNGSKGWNLAEMLKKVGKNIIPDGITVDQNGIRYFLGDNAARFDELIQQIRDIIDDGSLNYEEKKEQIKPLRNAVKELIRQTNTKDGRAKELIKAVVNKLDKLGIKKTVGRSAGIGEDGETHAFAGMAETKTKVKKENISEAIAEILESFYSDRAIEYMIKSGGMVEPALVIQQWIDFAKSGVAMLDGDTLTINGAYGEGEGVVSGVVTPDNIVLKIIDFEKGEFEIIEYETADKNYRVETNEAGTIDLQRVEKGRKKRIFSEQELKEIVKTVGRVKQEFGFNPDIEFGFDANNSFKVVQARANTVVKNAPAKSEIKPASILDTLFKDKTSPWYKIYTIAIAPIWEEWVFRGAPVIIASMLSINPLIPLIISGILFVALHKVFNKALTPRDLIILGGMTALYTLGVFMLPAIPFIGFFFGAFQSVTGYISPSVAMHFLYNFLAVYRVGIFKKAP
ncbi:MAG: CPBP family glutamic-type intramembrane protease, partial [Endomicrobia bacterium]|nr:CPBP family glutamic-type intramembrane protease [Endomicrobiia bacterium]